MPATFGCIDELVIRLFTINLQGRPGSKGKTMSSHSIYNRVNALRSFFAWLHEQGPTEEHILAGVKQPKTADLLIEPLTQEEIEKVLASMNPKTLLGARNKAIISLMLSIWPVPISPSLSRQAYNVGDSHNTFG